jgi:hypothetical protein
MLAPQWNHTTVPSTPASSSLHWQWSREKWSRPVSRFTAGSVAQRGGVREGLRPSWRGAGSRLDHLIRPPQERSWDRKAEHADDPAICQEIVPRRLLNGGTSLCGQQELLNRRRGPRQSELVHGQDSDAQQ